MLYMVTVDFDYYGTYIANSEQEIIDLMHYYGEYNRATIKRIHLSWMED